MAMPPPMNSNDDEDVDEYEGMKFPQINLNAFSERIKKLGLSDYLFAAGAALKAFHEARKRRQDHDTEE